MSRSQSRYRLRLFGVVAAVVTAAPVAVIGGASPAAAADTFQCATVAPLFNAATDGTLRRYPYTKVGRTDITRAAGVKIGSGWNNFGRLLGGPDGRIYGINTEGLSRYRYNGSGWDLVDGKQRWLISSSFASYATATWRNKITIDEIGDIYAITSTGQLQMWRFDEVTRQWVISGRILDTGWSKYDLIVSAGPGVIYARTPDGKLYRYRYEATSQRWIMYNRQVGSTGWDAFTKGLLSAGGDTLFGINASGVLLHYRWREDTGAWVVSRVEAGTGWAGYPNVFATTDSCRLTERHIPARPDTPLRADNPVVAVQGVADGTALGPLEYAYADLRGALLHAYQASPDATANVQWNPVNTSAAFTGRPALVTNGSGRVQMLAHSNTSDVRTFTRQAYPSTVFGAGLDLGGAMRSDPVVIKLSDNTLVAFALDASGALWFRPQGGTDNGLLPWRSLGGSGLTGQLTVQAGESGTATLFALDADGTPVTAKYQNQAVGAWSELGGSGFTGTVSVVVLPGPVLRVYARAADGQIMTQEQNSAQVFPGTWSAVGTFTSAGAPAATLDPGTRRLVVFARGADNEIYRSFETALGSNTYGPWLLIHDEGFSDPSVTDPTVTEFVGGNGRSYLVVFRNQNQGVRVYMRGDDPPAAVAAADGSTSAADPVLTRHTFPAPPK